jgi:hypothetical protein
MRYLCSSCNEVMPNEDGQTCPSCEVWGYPIITKDLPKTKKAYQMPRGKLKPVSRKQSNLLVSYRASGPMGAQEACCKCGANDHLTKHHPFGRSGTQDDQPCIALWIWLCQACHDWVHTNSNEAYQAGWLQPKYRNQTGDAPKPWTK